MYFVRKEICPTPLQQYLAQPRVSSIRFDAKLQSYTIKERGTESKRRGLISCLKHAYYPEYQRSTKVKARRAKKGSSKQQGINVDQQLCQYVKTGKYPRHRMAKAIVDFWAENGHTPVGAQIPVYIDRFKCVTQADVLTMTPDGQLWMNEVKTGYPTGGFRKKGHFGGDLLDQQIPNTVYNQWFLQCFYTTKGLRDAGLDVKGVIVQVYDEKDKGVTVKRLKHPKWIKHLIL